MDDSCASREIGFLVELDHYAGADPNDIYFRVGSNSYTVKSEVNSDEQLEYIKEYIAYVDNAISLGNRNAIEKLVDVDSLVDMYILQEYLKNTDAGYSSFFMISVLSIVIFARVVILSLSKNLAGIRLV